METTNLFWTWFNNNQKTLLNLRTLKLAEQQHYKSLLEWHLNFYVPGADYMLIFPNYGKHATQMIITANGNQSIFKKIEEIITSAPQIKDWKFLFFVNPSDDYEQIEKIYDTEQVIKDINLNSANPKFTSLEYDGHNKINMVVHLKEYTVHLQNKTLPQLIFILVQGHLCKNYFDKSINFIQVAQTLTEKSSGIIYLYEFQLYVDIINSTKPNI